MIVYSSDLRTV